MMGCSESQINIACLKLHWPPDSISDFYILSILESEEKQIESSRRPTIANLKGLKASFRKQIQRPIATRFPSYSKSGFTDTFKFIHFKRLAMPEQKMSVLMIIIAIVFVVRFIS